MSNLEAYDDTKHGVDAVVTAELVHEFPVVDAEVAAARSLFTYADAQRLKHKIDLRMLPPLFFAYLIKSVDSKMTSYVAAMNSDTSKNILTELNMSDNTWAYASTAYSITYTVFEIPSNLTIKWATPRLHLTRILVIWSIVAACTAACRNGASYLACRALLGLAEAGFYPGILYYFNAWYRPDEMAFRLFAIGTLNQFSGVVDTLIAYGFSYVDTNVSNWRYCYIVIGCAGSLVGLWMWYILPDFPDSPPSRRQFFSPDEAKFMSARLPPSAVRADEASYNWPAIWSELRSPLFWAYGMSVQFLAAGTSGLTFWLPTILKDFKLTSSTQSLLLNVPPAILYVLVQLSTGWFMDHDTRVPRHLILITCAAWLVAGYLGLIFITGAGGRYAMIFIVYIPYAAYYGMIYPLRTQSLKQGTAAVALAGLNVFACIPDFYTAQIFQDKYAPKYVVPFVVCMVFCGMAGVSAAITWYLVYDNEKMTRMVARKRRAAGKATNLVLDEDVLI